MLSNCGYYFHCLASYMTKSSYWHLTITKISPYYFKSEVQLTPVKSFCLWSPSNLVIPPSKSSQPLLKKAIHQGIHKHELLHLRGSQSKEKTVVSALLIFVELHPQLPRTGHLSSHQCPFYSSSWLPKNLLFHRCHFLVLMTDGHVSCVLYEGSEGNCLSSTVQMVPQSHLPSVSHLCITTMLFVFPTWTLSSGLQMVTYSFNYPTSTNAKETSDCNTVMRIRNHMGCQRWHTSLLLVWGSHQPSYLL